jgi:hypothetical protein
LESAAYRIHARCDANLRKPPNACKRSYFQGCENFSLSILGNKIYKFPSTCMINWTFLEPHYGKSTRLEYGCCDRFRHPRVRPILYLAQWGSLRQKPSGLRTPYLYSTRVAKFAGSNQTALSSANAVKNVKNSKNYKFCSII